MKDKKPMFTMKKLRKEKGLTQISLGEKVGVNWRVLSRYERGDRRPDIATLYNISVALDCDMNILAADLL